MVSLAYLDELVPTSGDDDRVLRVRGESHAGDPLSVALVSDGVLAVAEGVPELDGAVTGAGDDLAVVGREADAQNVVCLLYTSPSPRDGLLSRMPSSA